MTKATTPRRGRVYAYTTQQSWPDLPASLRQRFGTLEALLERHHAREGQRFIIGGYLLAEHFGVSGPLETVTDGMFLGVSGRRVMSPTMRLETGANW
jgi:hypothetical protein